MKVSQQVKEAELRFRESWRIAFRVAAMLLLMFASISAVASAQTSQGSAAEDLINPDRPGIADGSNVVGRGRLQIETGVQQEFRNVDQDKEHTFFLPTLFRVGISDRWEARVEGNTFTRTSVSGAAASGLAPISVGFKFHMQDSGGLRRPSLGMIFRVFPASGSGDFHSDHVVTDLRLGADWDIASKFSLNPNLGIVRGEDGNGSTFPALLSAVTLNYAPTRKLNPFVDFGLQAPEEKKGKASLIFDGGVAWIIGRNVQLDASVGNGAHGATPPRPFLSGGISVRSHP